MTESSFRYPLFVDQLFGDLGNGTALQAGVSRDIGTGDRLLGADQIENYAPVYISGGLACRDMKT